MNWFCGKAVRVLVLPLLLGAATVLGLGSYTETSDDQTMGWLFSGVLALKPVPALPLYLHGYGHLLAAAYAAVPGVSWLGLLLGALLAAATALVFAVLNRLLQPCLRPVPLALGLALFFGLAWLEHWLWFSHGRVALLLAGAGVLYAAQRPGRRGALLLGLLGLGAAWLVRPGLAVLGAVAVVPAALLLAGGGRRAAPVLSCAVLGLLLATGILHGQQTPAEASAQRRDAFFARVLDYHQLQPQPRTAADSLGTAAIGLWLFGDATVVNEGLRRRAYRFDGAQFLLREAPARLGTRLGLLARDYFPVLLGLAVAAGAVVRRRGPQGWFWLVQAGFAGGLLLLAGLLKLPPRLALPLLDFWLLTNVAFWRQSPPEPALPEASARGSRCFGFPVSPLGRGLGRGGLLVVLGLYGAKTWHRHQVLAREQNRHQHALRQLARLEPGAVRVLAGTNDWLKSLSPFRAYTPGPGPVLQLTGWPSHDASQAALRQRLSGSPDQTECLRRLARWPAGPAARVQWVLTPETARWLSRRFRLDGPRLLLTSEATPLPYNTSSPVRVYNVQPWPMH